MFSVSNIWILIPGLWLPVLLAILGAFLLFGMGIRSRDYRLCWCGITLAVANNITVLLLPVILGHWSNGNMDHLEHIGYVTSMIAGYYSGTEFFNPYPLFHALPGVIAAVSPIAPNVAVQLVPAILCVAYVIGMYRLGKYIFKDYDEVLTLTFLSTLLVIPYSGAVDYQIVPLILPLILCMIALCYHKPTKTNIALMLLVLAVSPAFHPDLLPVEFAVVSVIGIKKHRFLGVSAFLLVVTAVYSAFARVYPWDNISIGAALRLAYFIPVFLLPFYTPLAKRLLLDVKKVAAPAISLLIAVSLWGTATVWERPYQWYTYQQIEIIKTAMAEHNPVAYDELIVLIGPDKARKIITAIYGQHWYRTFEKEWGY